MKPKHSQLFQATAVLAVTFSTGAFAQTSNFWTGAESTAWNTDGNWSLNHVPTNTPAPGEHAVINITPTNVATISADIPTPVDIIVGTGAGSNGRLDHTAGTASTGAGNWFYVGTAGGTGLYNMGVPGGTGVNSGLNQGSGSMNVAGRFYVGGAGAAGSNGTANINTTGTLAVGSWMHVGSNGSTGVLNLDSGAITVGERAEFGVGTGSNGTLNMSGGSITKTGGEHFVIAKDGGTAVANITGGTITVNNEVWVGQAANSNGTLNFSGGTITNNSWVAIGRSGGAGTVNMTGGTWNKTGESNFIVGASGSGVTSTMNMSGGVVNVAPHVNANRGITWIGEQNGVTGILNLSNTAEFNTDEMVLAAAAGSNGIVNLNGGILRASRLAGGAGNATVTFNGTQIIATGDRAAFITNLDSATISAGGMLIDTQAFSVGSDQSFAGTGGITKTGAGTLALNATSTYTGATVVNEGVLNVVGNLSGTSGVSVASGASLTGSGTIAGLSTIASGGTLDPTGTINVTNLDFESGSTFLATLTGNGANDRINATGALTIDGMIEVLLNYQASAGDSFDLADFATLSGTPTFDFSSAALDPGLSWDTSSFTTNGVISVIPEPSALLLGLLGTGFFLRRRR